MRYRITIETLRTQDPFEPLPPPIQLEAEVLEITQQAGLTYVYDNPGKRRAVQNGQYRTMIKGCVGCHSYDSFTTDHDI
jgi:hypothetical protein